MIYFVISYYTYEIYLNHKSKETKIKYSFPLGVVLLTLKICYLVQSLSQIKIFWLLRDQVKNWILQKRGIEYKRYHKKLQLLTLRVLRILFLCDKTVLCH